MSRQDEQLNEILKGMSKLIETSNLNQQQLNMFKEQVDQLQSEIRTLREQVTELKAQNELTNCHFRELYKTQSLEELLEKMSSIGKEAVKADECIVYGMNNDAFSELLKFTDAKLSFVIDSDRHHVMYVPLEDQQGDVIGFVYAKRGGDEMFTEADARVFNLNEGELGTIFRACLEQKMAENNAVTDKLTKLQNREGMSNFIKEDVLSRVQKDNPVSVVMFDIDHFKRFNDTYGHDIGDKCLKLVADTIKGSVRADDGGAFRWGGEEMVVILPVNEERAFEIAERIRHAVENATLVVDERTGSTTRVAVSGGVSEFKPETIELDKNRIESAFERCLKEADNHLYEAKENGRNRIYGSELLMQTHYSLPSPTELFQHWYDSRNQNHILMITTTTDVAGNNNWKISSAVRHNSSNPSLSHDFVVSNNESEFNRSCINGVVKTDVFRNNLLEILNAVTPDSKYNETFRRMITASNKDLAVITLNEWEQSKNAIDDNTYQKYILDIEVIKAMVYTPDAINVRNIIDERREQITAGKTAEDLQFLHKNDIERC